MAIIAYKLDTDGILIVKIFITVLSLIAIIKYFVSIEKIKEKLKYPIRIGIHFLLGYGICFYTLSNIMLILLRFS
ncbi:hypothetical protein [Cetobacterium sp. SF1]|uniref:hypothetical protein n=1 Tax=unclassified Cetobacterium TaxID=2630983 RepID=UPI003CE88F1B